MQDLTDSHSCTRNARDGVGGEIFEREREREGEGGRREEDEAANKLANYPGRASFDYSPVVNGCKNDGFTVRTDRAGASARGIDIVRRAFERPYFRISTFSEKISVSALGSAVSREINVSYRLHIRRVCEINIFKRRGISIFRRREFYNISFCVCVSLLTAVKSGN